LRAWLAAHRAGFIAALARIALAPVGSTLNALVIGIALSLPVGLYLIVVSLQAASHQMTSTPQISAFMALDANRSEIAQIEARLKQSSRIATFRLVAKDQALAELKKSSGLADVIDGLPQNPLPDAFIIEATDTSPAALEALRDEIRQWPRVAHVQLDAQWARRLDAGLRFGRIVAALLGTLLGIALVAVTFNTIRLQVLTRREEIEVIKLIGATDAFIQRPFLYFGALQGLAGGAIALLIVSAGAYLANRGLGELSHVYASLLQLNTLSAGDSAALLAAPAALGWFGAWLSVSRHLALIEPS
jgi:cell division transport system permease protein